MLAKGCVINGANTILIDVNAQALELARTELKSLVESSEDSKTTEVLTSVLQT